MQAQWEADPASWLRGEVTVDGTPDALAGDNRVFFSLPPVIEGKVALLAQSPYLRLALSPEVMRGQWATRVLEPTKLAAELAANEDADVLVVESNYLQSGDARKLLWRYLTNGRGVRAAGEPGDAQHQRLPAGAGLRGGRHGQRGEGQRGEVPVRVLRTIRSSIRSCRRTTAA